MPKGLPFSVDTWTSSSKRKRRHFLTHAHKDHSFGISSQFSFPIYSTLLTKSLVLQHYPQVCLCFQGFFIFFKKMGLSLILWVLYSLSIHCLWKLKLGNRWLWTILMGLSLSRLLMPTTALVIYCSSFIVFDWLCIVFCCLIGLLMWVLWKSCNFVLIVGYFMLYI